MSTEQSDGELLLRYVRSGTESAFADLVERHLDLVYATAVRIVGGDRHLANDVCQCVFIDLAKKAKTLTHRSHLIGWLYQSTCYAAAKAVRSERRWQARQIEMQHSIHLSPPSTDTLEWEAIRPMLDARLLDLPEIDRDAILLRFLKNYSFAEVGNQIGLTENAARMRVDRALEKLRLSLLRHGITSSTVALATTLSGQLTMAAPAGLAPSILAACSQTTTTGTLVFVFGNVMSNTKGIILGTAIAATALAPLFVQYRANQSLRRELEALRQERSALAAAVVDQNQSTGIATPTTGSDDHQELLRLRGEIAEYQRRYPASKKANSGTSETKTLTANGQGSEVNDAQVADFLQRPAADQGRLLGTIRDLRKFVENSTNSSVNLEETRALAAKVRLNLESLEGKPAEFADFQSSYIESVVGIKDPTRVAQIRDIIRQTYEHAVSANLDASSRPKNGVVEWAIRRDALDRPATASVKRLLTPEEAQRFDLWFLGIMGIDLGTGDGAWHRFVDERGTIHFPSEPTPPVGNP